MNRAAATNPSVVRRSTRSCVCLLIAACCAFVIAHAEPVHSLTGWVQPAVAPYDRYGQFVVLHDPLDQVRAILHDPQGLLTANLPARLNLRANITQPRGPEDEPVFQVAHVEAGSPSSDTEAITATSTPPWMDLAGDLFHPKMNVTPRLFSLTDDDEDGDRFPEGRDVFPGIPDEWRDTDQDGIGDNADPDDDNDGMSDNYEALCELNSFLPDANADADSDGMSNGDEALAGTLANNASSLFILTVEANRESGKLNIRWPALPTRVYSLEVADSPSGRWHRVLDGLRPPVAADYTFSLVLAEQPTAYIRAIAAYP